MKKICICICICLCTQTAQVWCRFPYIGFLIHHCIIAPHHFSSSAPTVRFGSLLLNYTLVPCCSTTLVACCSTTLVPCCMLLKYTGTLLLNYTGGLLLKYTLVAYCSTTLQLQVYIFGHICKKPRLGQFLHCYGVIPRHLINNLPRD